MVGSDSVLSGKKGYPKMQQWTIRELCKNLLLHNSLTLLLSIFYIIIHFLYLFLLHPLLLFFILFYFLKKVHHSDNIWNSLHCSLSSIGCESPCYPGVVWVWTWSGCFIDTKKRERGRGALGCWMQIKNLHFFIYII